MTNQEYDLVVRGGTVVDGTRVPKLLADVGMKDGRIAKIGRIDDSGSARVLDASDCIVAPGFIDVHTHYDAQIHWDPYCTISGWHGVTSVVLGNCGFGFAPCKPELRERAMLMMTRTEQIPYESMKEGMPWQVGVAPGVARCGPGAAEGRERRELHAALGAHDLCDGPRGVQVKASNA